MMEKTFNPFLFSYSHIFFLFVFSFAFLVVGSDSKSILTDREALLSFKSRITDPSGALSSWNRSSDVCTWAGVTCNDDKYSRRVSSLNLRSLGLTGPISPQLGNISFLGALYLQDNQFSGVLPSQVGDLLQLQVLNVSSNNVEGTIPANITKCRELKVLDLSGNTISGRIPTDLGILRNLQTLRLGSNRLTGAIPPTIGNLSSLTILDLGTNTLNGPIPSDLGRLKNLQYLHLIVNNLTGTVPSALYNLSSLTHLDLASNNLRGEITSDIGFRLPNLLLFHYCFNEFTGPIPASLHNITKIQSIRMSHNFLRGQVPPGLGNLHDLTMYNIGFNLIVSNDLGFITSLTNSSKLWFLAVDENLLEGVIPESVGNLSKSLQKLYMGGNRISGTIPASIGQLTSLTLLNLSHNSISGDIPSAISQNKELQVLSLAGNRLAGEIPPALGNLSKLTKVELYGNALEWSIPSSFSNYKSLLSLDLSDNKLNGSIPTEMFGLSSLTSLNLSKNHLSGSLPENTASLVNVETIDVSGNALSGTIPDSVGDCKSLQVLWMSRNLLSGPIPSKFSNLKGLQSLDLSSNELSGSIPDYLGDLRTLQFLNLSFNNLEGEIPKGGIFRNSSSVHLQGNPGLCMAYASSASCTNKRAKSSRLKISTTVKILIPVIALIIVCILLGFLWLDILRRRKTGAKVVARSDSFLKHHRPISYDELLQATGNFDSRNLIGTGGFGSVYKGILRDGVAVAIKVLSVGITGASKSFLAECESLRNVRHRNLAKLITSCSSIDHANNPFLAIVYEFLSNGNLDEWIHGKRRHEDGKKLSLVERLNIAIDVASPIDYLHNDCEVAVVHRDLKPSNVLLDTDMTAKVGDFGLSKLLAERPGDQESLTSTHRIKGSIGYIPPEYGVGGKPSTKGDVYSYGIMLLEMLTGKSPTNEIFQGGMSLETWVRSAWPDRVVEVLDDDLLPIHEMNIEGHPISAEKQQECVGSMLKLALNCTVESFDERTQIRDVVQQLKGIKSNLVKLHLDPKPKF